MLPYFQQVWEFQQHSLGGELWLTPHRCDFGLKLRRLGPRFRVGTCACPCSPFPPFPLRLTCSCFSQLASLLCCSASSSPRRAVHPPFPRCSFPGDPLSPIITPHPPNFHAHVRCRRACSSLLPCRSSLGFLALGFRHSWFGSELFLHFVCVVHRIGLLTNRVGCSEGTMLARQGLRSVSRTWAAARPMLLARSFGAEPEGKAAEAVVPEKFKEDWAKIAPNYDLPHFPSSFMQARPPVPATIPAKLTVNFMLPHMFEMQAKEVSVLSPSLLGSPSVQYLPL